MHGRFRPQISQHPFHVSRGGEPAGSAGLVSHFQHRELDRRVQGHVNPQLRADAALRVLEDAVAESVPADVRRRSAAGQRRGGPEVAALFVAEVKGFSARIAHGVVVPGSEAELVGILAPGVGQAALRDDGSEVRVRQHIHPRRRRHLPVRGRNDVLAPIRGESAQPVEEEQIAARQRGGCRGFGAVGSGRREARHGYFRQGRGG